jgi:hypothetical protein
VRGRQGILAIRVQVKNSIMAKDQMGVTRSICRTPTFVVVLVLLACVGVSAWALISRVTPLAEALLDRIADSYDEYLPEITIRNGKASIRQKQPFFVDSLTSDEGIVVIDTRDGKQSEALRYLKGARNGAVLTRDNLFLKNPNQIRIVPLAHVPNMVLSSRDLLEIKREYFPLILRVGAILVVIYFLIAKPLQILLLALIPYFGARLYSVRLTYGAAFKVGTFAMIPPIILSLFTHYSSISLTISVASYFVLYIILLLLAVSDLVKTSAPAVEPDSPISP